MHLRSWVSAGRYRSERAVKPWWICAASGSNPFAQKSHTADGKRRREQRQPWSICATAHVSKLPMLTYRVAHTHLNGTRCPKPRPRKSDHAHRRSGRNLIDNTEQMVIPAAYGVTTRAMLCQHLGASAVHSAMKTQTQYETALRTCEANKDHGKSYMGDATLWLPSVQNRGGARAATARLGAPRRCCKVGRSSAWRPRASQDHQYVRTACGPQALPQCARCPFA